jgi:hypothetical protein
MSGAGALGYSVGDAEQAGATVALALTLHELRQPAAHRASRAGRIEGP